MTIANLRKEREKENDFKDMVECSSAHPSPKATVKVGGIVVAVTNELILVSYIHSNDCLFSVDDANLGDDDLDYLKIILNPFSATVLIVGSEGLEASVHSWITYLSLESWPRLYSRQLSPLVHVVDVVGVGEGVAPNCHLRRCLLQRLGCGFQGGLRPGVVSVFLCFALFDPFSDPPGEEVVPEVHEVLLFVALALSLQTYFTMVDNFQEKIRFVRDCQRSSKDTCNQARMLCVEFQQPR